MYVAIFCKSQNSPESKSPNPRPQDQVDDKYQVSTYA